MTVTIPESAFYIGLTILLIAIQAYQQYQIRNLQKEIRRLWEQAASSAIILFTKVDELDKKVNNK